jgi:hypothetical protein
MENMSTVSQTPDLFFLGEFKQTNSTATTFFNAAGKVTVLCRR